MDGDQDQAFGELKARVDLLLEGFREFRFETREFRRELADRLDGHSRRLGALERWRSWLAGALAMLGVVWGVAWGWWMR